MCSPRTATPSASAITGTITVTYDMRVTGQRLTSHDMSTYAPSDPASVRYSKGQAAANVAGSACSSPRATLIAAQTTAPIAQPAAFAPKGSWRGPPPGGGDHPQGFAPP